MIERRGFFASAIAAVAALFGLKSDADADAGDLRFIPMDTVPLAIAAELTADTVDPLCMCHFRLSGATDLEYSKLASELVKGELDFWRDNFFEGVEPCKWWEHPIVILPDGMELESLKVRPVRKYGDHAEVEAGKETLDLTGVPYVEVEIDIPTGISRIIRQKS